MNFWLWLVRIGKNMSIPYFLEAEGMTDLCPSFFWGFLGGSEGKVCLQCRRPHFTDPKQAREDVWCPQSHAALTWCHPGCKSVVPVFPAHSILGSPYTHERVHRALLWLYSQCNGFSSRIAPSCGFSETWETDVCSWSILLLFQFVLFQVFYPMGLKTVEGEDNDEARHVLANERIINCAA